MRVPLALMDKHGLWVFKGKDSKGLSYNVPESMGGNGAVIVQPDQVEKQWGHVKGWRPEPKAKIVQQGKYECSPAAMATLIGEKLFNVKRAYAKFGWRNDSSGATDLMMVRAGRELGIDLVKVQRGQIKEDVGPGLVIVDSLNYKNAGHVIVWNGEEILDTNWGKPGRAWWGVEWAPWTVGAYCIWEICKKRTDDEFNEYVKQFKKGRIV